jgi:hypothetical protein
MATTSNSLSDQMEQDILNHILGTMAMSDNTGYDLELALFTGDPGDDDTGTELDNVNSPGYARQLISRSDVNVQADGDGYAATLNTTVEFEASGGDWAQNPAWLAIYDTNSFYMLFRGEIDDGASAITSGDMTDGKKLQFTSGNLKFKLS